MTINITLFGAAGRMGQTLCQLIEQDDNLHLVGALEHVGSPALGERVTPSSDIRLTADFTEALKAADVVIDFALADGLQKRIQACRDHSVAMLIGTTGLSADELTLISEAGDDIPILWASNMSLGVNVIFALAAQAAKALGLDQHDGFKVSITETHHIHKTDAPSGTALSIGQAVSEVAGNPPIDYHSYREGEVIGDHTITFESNNERIEITHHAKDRRLFAQGGLRLASLLANKTKGHYQVVELINLE